MAREEQPSTVEGFKEARQDGNNEFWRSKKTPRSRLETFVILHVSEANMASVLHLSKNKYLSGKTHFAAVSLIFETEKLYLPSTSHIAPNSKPSINKSLREYWHHFQRNIPNSNSSITPPPPKKTANYSIWLQHKAPLPGKKKVVHLMEALGGDGHGFHNPFWFASILGSPNLPFTALTAAIFDWALNGRAHFFVLTTLNYTVYLVP